MVWLLADTHYASRLFLDVTTLAPAGAGRNTRNAVDNIPDESDVEQEPMNPASHEFNPSMVIVGWIVFLFVIVPILYLLSGLPF